MLSFSFLRQPVQQGRNLYFCWSSEQQDQASAGQLLLLLMEHKQALSTDITAAETARCSRERALCV